MNNDLFKIIEEIKDNLDDALVPDFDVEKVNQHVYKFSVNDLNYQVEITESIADNKKIIEIKFKLLNNPKSLKKSDFKTDQQYQIALKKNQVGITGTGNPIQVFKKVIGSIIKVINEVSPDYITFSADELNRQSLYSKMINIVGKYLNIKYITSKVNPITNDVCGEEEFWLVKFS